MFPYFEGLNTVTKEYSYPCIHLPIIDQEL